MEAMRESWTDERLDDFRVETARRLDGLDSKLEKIDERFEQIDARFDKVDAKFERLEARFDAKFDKIDARFERLEERLEALNHTMLQFGIGSIIVFVVGFASLLAAQL
jgi:archaellum component FlaC